MDIGEEKTAIELDFIPECIGNLKHLRFLYLEGHSGITLPESMKYLTQLEKQVSQVWD